MDRMLSIQVAGNYLTKDNKNAGVQHEGNVTFLRITFDEGWKTYAKKITWWDARGQNPVAITLTTNLLEDITESTQVYRVPIPPEPLAEAGACTFVLDGYRDGKRQRSVSDKLLVKPAPFEENPDEPTDPTPSQAEQLQEQIDTIIDTIQDAAIAAEEAAKSAAAAKVSEENAAQSAQEAIQSAEDAEEDAERADLARRAVENMTVSAKSLEPEYHATVEKSIVNRAVHLEYGIPRGLRGEQGPEGPRGPQGVQGPEGPRGIAGVAVQTAGYVAFNVTEEGILQCTYTGDEQPDYAINEEGHLTLTI